MHIILKSALTEPPQPITSFRYEGYCEDCRTTLIMEEDLGRHSWTNHLWNPDTETMPGQYQYP